MPWSEQLALYAHHLAPPAAELSQPALVALPQLGSVKTVFALLVPPPTPNASLPTAPASALVAYLLITKPPYPAALLAHPHVPPAAMPPTVPSATPTSPSKPTEAASTPPPRAPTSSCQASPSSA